MAGTVGSVYGLFTSPTMVNSRDLKEMKEDAIGLSQQLRSSGRLGRYSDPAIVNVTGLVKSENDVTALARREIDVVSLSERQGFVSTKIQEAQEANLQLMELLMKVRSPTPPLAGEYQARLRNLLDATTAALNGRYLDKNLFNGPRDDSDAVLNLSTLSPLGAGSSPSYTDYIVWQDLPNAQAQIDDLDGANHIDRFIVDATHISFQKTICALRMALSGDPSNTNDPAVVDALNMARSAVDDYGGAIVLSGINEEILDKAVNSIQDQSDDNQIMLNRLNNAQELPTIFHQLKMLEVTERVTEYISTDAIRKMKEFIDRH